jgi:hypothetical protein
MSDARRNTHDVALVEAGVITTVWRNKSLAQVAEGPCKGRSATLIEVPKGPNEVVCGMLWDGTKLSMPPIAAPV